MLGLDDEDHLLVEKACGKSKPFTIRDYFKECEEGWIQHVEKCGWFSDEILDGVDLRPLILSIMTGKKLCEYWDYDLEELIEYSDEIAGHVGYLMQELLLNSIYSDDLKYEYIYFDENGQTSCIFKPDELINAG